jgi:2-hydroxychromene-2-carboxylate isomerase
MRANGATIADRLHERLLEQARPRTGPPKQRKGPGRDSGASFGKLSLNNASLHTASALAAQRAVRAAARRIADLELKAEIAEAIGLRDAALRLAATAAQIRQMLR